MLKFQLNLRKPNNYAFFCPVSKMHLTVSNPLGFAEGVTPAILRGLKSKALLDVDNVVDMATGKLKTAKQDGDVKKNQEDEKLNQNGDITPPEDTPTPDTPDIPASEPIPAPPVEEETVQPSAPEAPVATNKRRGKKSSTPANVNNQTE